MPLETPPPTTKALEPRLYVLLRGDLPPGLLLAQTGHVTRKFTRAFPQIPVPDDENLVVLAEKDEPSLLRRLELLQWEVPLASIEEFREPDLDGTLTAFAVHGGVTPETALLLRKLLSDLPLALKWLERYTLVRDAA